MQVMPLAVWLTTFVVVFSIIQVLCGKFLYFASDCHFCHSVQVLSQVAIMASLLPSPHASQRDCAASLCCMSASWRFTVFS